MSDEETIDQMYAERETIIPRLLDAIRPTNSIQAATEACKWTTCYYFACVIEMHRQSGSGMKPEDMLDAWFETMRDTVAEIHAQLILPPPEPN